MTKSCSSSASKRMSSGPADSGCCLESTRTEGIRRSWFVVLLTAGIFLMVLGFIGMGSFSRERRPAQIPPAPPKSVTYVTPMTTSTPAPSRSVAPAPPAPAKSSPSDRIRKHVSDFLLARERETPDLDEARRHMSGAVKIVREILPPKDMRRHKIEALVRAYTIFERTRDPERMLETLDHLETLVLECL